MAATIWWIISLKFFMHPLPLSAIALMALNDHWLKYKYPGFITGKLSDFCGVFYFPIFLLALGAALFQILKGNAYVMLKAHVLWAILFTDTLMIIVKLSTTSSRWIEEFFALHIFQIQLTQDWTDLMAFSINPLTYFYLRLYFRK